MTEFAIFAALLVLFGSISRKVSGTAITAPAVFTGAGLLVGGLGAASLTARARQRRSSGT